MDIYIEEDTLFVIQCSSGFPKLALKDLKKRNLNSHRAGLLADLTSNDVDVEFQVKRFLILCLQSSGVYVENLSEFVVRSPSEVLHLLAVGKKRLVFAETKMNRNSSRYHSL